MKLFNEDRPLPKGKDSITIIVKTARGKKRKKKSKYSKTAHGFERSPLWRV